MYKTKILRKTLIIAVTIFALSIFIYNTSSANSFSEEIYIDNHLIQDFQTPRIADVNASICNNTGIQYSPQICSDGADGAIITWIDKRSGFYDIYAQRINSTGDVQWTPNGIPICTVSGSQYTPRICSDGAGGAIITWEDERSDPGDIFVQRINSTGLIEWAAGGVSVCTATKAQELPKICPDGANGAIITWYDQYLGSDFTIYAQRVDANGIMKWAPNGELICTIETPFLQEICSDGSGGAIITWRDFRGIYAQRVDAVGINQWKDNGTAVSTLSSTFGTGFFPRICTDNSGGAIIAWRDGRFDDGDIYAQRVNSSGNGQWIENGTYICTAVNTQFEHEMCADGYGGAIITWEDNRTGTIDIYTQRIGFDGVKHWTVDGKAVCTANNAQYDPEICTDRSGGAFITWEDERNDSGDIYAQHIYSNGSIQWTTNGFVICSKINTQRYPKICSTESEGAILTWQDAGDISAYLIGEEIIDSNGTPTPEDSFPIYIILVLISVVGVSVVSIFIIIRYLRSKK